MFQFLIYDNDREDCYNPDGVIVEVSCIYHDRNNCEAVAIQTVKELEQTHESSGRFQYIIDETHWAD